jgi:hypothetical protein
VSDVPKRDTPSEGDDVREQRACASAAAVSQEAALVSVVVTACEDSPSLRACLASVASQARSVAGEVLLIVNAAPGGLSEEARVALESLCHRVLFEPQAG